MKSRLNIIITTLILLLTMSYSLYSQVQSVMTFNIRYDNPNDGINQWDNRKEAVVDFINYYNPDVFGIQEGLHHQVQYLEENLVEYTRIGVGRDDGKNKGEFSAIFYKKKALSLLKESTFWLSDTEDNISVGWDASMERICTYGLFESRSDSRRVYVFNTHYDHIGKKARHESSKLILKKIDALNSNDYPVVLMGDFNAEPNSPPILEILAKMDDASVNTEHKIYGPVGTFTGFKKETIPERRIDYIFTIGLEVTTYRHIDDKMKNNNYLSDHLPVMIDIKYSNK